ncbi:MAG: thioredoxin domain-containing protein [Actinomycetota bacterium]|nr:thioredoxin domain-containing protein [Actinomycetota bacterium]
MASRKEQKEQARARREAEEQARAVHERRQRRLRMVIGSVLVAVAIIAVLIAVSSGGGASVSGLQKGKTSAKTTAAVQNLLTGIPQSGATLGSSSAPVTMTYYGDLQCPICRDFTLSGGFAPLVANEVRAGKVKIVYKAFETATKDPNVFKVQQVAALAAGQQQRFWNFTELFYREQGPEGTGYVSQSYLSGLAKQIPGFDLTKWQTDRSSSSLATSITTDEQAGTKLGVQGTPTLIMTGPKGSTVPGNGSVPAYSDLQAAYKKVA